ncbi:MAG: hypothetical protein ACTIJR_07975 [Brevibacterium linens]
MAGEGKFGLNIEAVYVHTDDGDVPLLEYLEAQGGDVSVSWADVSGKPSTFTPDTHTHAIGDVDGLQAALDSKADSSDLTAKADTSALSALEARVAALEAPEA